MSNFFWAELPIFLIYLLGSSIGLYLGIHPFIKKLPTTTVKFNLRESQKANAKAIHPAFLWFGQIGSILFVVAGIFLLLQDRMSVAVGLLSIIFFGFTTLVYAYMIYLRNKP